MARKLTMIRETRSKTPEGKTRRGVELYERLADESLELIGHCDAGEVAGDVLPDVDREIAEDVARMERGDIPVELSIPALPELTVIDGGKR